MTDYINKIELPDGTMVEINDVPKGGTQSQVLTKISDADSDFGWASIPQQDLSSYATKSELNSVAQSIPDVSGFATSSDLISGLATKSDSSSVYTKEQVDAKVSSVYRYKGTVASESELPKDSNVVGDVYNVEDTGANYAWTGTEWDKLSETVDLTPYALKDSVYTKEQVNNIVTAGAVDLTPYYNKTEVNGLLINKADISSVPTKVSQLNNDTGYLTSIPSEYVTESELDSKGYLTEHQDISALATKQELTNGLASKQPTGDYALKSEIPTKITQLDNDANYLTSIPSEYVTESELDSKGYLTEHQDISNKADKSTTLSGYGITDAYTKSEIDNMLGTIDTVLDEILGA